MKVKVNVKANIDPRLIARRVPKANNILATRAANDTEKFVPMLTGSQKNRTKVEGAKIIYEGPYAHYLYVGKLYVDPATGSSWVRHGQKKTITDKNLVFTKSEHPDAQDHWFEASKALNLDNWLDVYRKEMGRDT